MTLHLTRDIIHDMNHKKIRIIRDLQVNLRPLRGKNVAVIGYGSQGEAQALNLRDSGITPLIGLRRASRSKKKANGAGFKVVDIADAMNEADIIAIMIPDHEHRNLFDKYVDDKIKPGKAFVFAHALSAHFGLVSRPLGVDFLLVAPHGPGIRLREQYIVGKGIPAFVGSIPQTKKALNIAAAYGKAIGCARAGLIVTTFENEAIGDIFGEQAVLCGGLAGLLKAGFNTLVESGIPPHNAYLECVYQLDLIVDLIKRYGIEGMYRRISLTANIGSRDAENIVINRQSINGMKKLLDRIKKGEFAKKLINKTSSTHNLRHQRSRNELIDRMALLFAREIDT